MIKIFKPKCYIKILFEVIDYLKQPNYEPPLNLSISNKIQDTIILFIISLIITLFFTLLIVIIFNPTKSFNKEFEILYSPLLQLIIGSVILPILEETTFRLSLIFKPIFLGFTFSCISYYIATKLFFQTDNYDFGNNLILRIATSLFIGIVIFLISNKYSEIFKNLWKNNFRFIFYISILTFAWIHIFNYKNSLFTFILLPILTFPQLIGSIRAGFLRMNYGFLYCLSTHIILNFFILLVQLFISKKL